MAGQTVPISNKLRQFIMRNEHHLARGSTPFQGFNPDLGRFFMEPDPIGIPTVGFGHRITEDELRAGVFDRGLSFEQAQELLDRDILTHQGHAAKVMGPKLFFSMPQDFQDAATALTYQIGRTGFRRFKNFRAALMSGDLEGARKESLTHAKGRPLHNRQQDLNATFFKESLFEDNFLNVDFEPPSWFNKRDKDK